VGGGDKVMVGMRENRVGVLGHYYCGMLDVLQRHDAAVCAFGNHFEILEICALHKLREAVTASEVQTKIAQFETEFEVSRECAAAELTRAARTSCALDRIVSDHHLGSLAYYYETRRPCRTGTLPPR